MSEFCESYLTSNTGRKKRVQRSQLGSVSTSSLVILLLNLGTFKTNYYYSHISNNGLRVVKAASFVHHHYPNARIAHRKGHVSRRQVLEEVPTLSRYVRHYTSKLHCSYNFDMKFEPQLLAFAPFPILLIQ